MRKKWCPYTEILPRQIMKSLPKNTLYNRELSSKQKQNAKNSKYSFETLWKKFSIEYRILFELFCLNRYIIILI